MHGPAPMVLHPLLKVFFFLRGKTIFLFPLKALYHFPTVSGHLVKLSPILSATTAADLQHCFQVHLFIFSRASCRERLIMAHFWWITYLSNLLNVSSSISPYTTSKYPLSELFTLCNISICFTIDYCVVSPARVLNSWMALGDDQ